jgi:hypothetical protein
LNQKDSHVISSERFLLDVFRTRRFSGAAPNAEVVQFRLRGLKLAQPGLDRHSALFVAGSTVLLSTIRFVDSFFTTVRDAMEAPMRHDNLLNGITSVTETLWTVGTGSVAAVLPA